MTDAIINTMLLFLITKRQQGQLWSEDEALFYQTLLLNSTAAMKLGQLQLEKHIEDLENEQTNTGGVDRDSSSNDAGE